MIYRSPQIALKSSCVYYSLIEGEQLNVFPDPTPITVTIAHHLGI